MVIYCERKGTYFSPNRQMFRRKCCVSGGFNPPFVILTGDGGGTYTQTPSFAEADSLLDRLLVALAQILVQETASCLQNGVV